MNIELSVDAHPYFDILGSMEIKSAIDALSALAQDTRLSIFRLLVRNGPEGLNAGEIGDRVGVAASTLSHHLATLERAGLLRSWRVQRQIFYAADFAGIRGLLSFLMEDCCRGLPEICDGLIPPGGRDPAAATDRSSSDEAPSSSCCG